MFYSPRHFENKKLPLFQRKLLYCTATVHCVFLVSWFSCIIKYFDFTWFLLRWVSNSEAQKKIGVIQRLRKNYSITLTVTSLTIEIMFHYWKWLCVIVRFLLISWSIAASHLEGISLTCCHFWYWQSTNSMDSILNIRMTNSLTWTG